MIVYSLYPVIDLNANSSRNDLRERGWDFVQAADGRIAWKVCNNITASNQYRDYRVEWRRGFQAEDVDEMAVGRGEGFLELLEPGFIVVLWARAQVRELLPCETVSSLPSPLANMNDSNGIGVILLEPQPLRSSMSYEWPRRFPGVSNSKLHSISVSRWCSSFQESRLVHKAKITKETCTRVTHALNFVFHNINSKKRSGIIKSMS